MEGRFMAGVCCAVEVAGCGGGPGALPRAGMSLAFGQGCGAWENDAEKNYERGTR